MPQHDRSPHKPDVDRRIGIETVTRGWIESRSTSDNRVVHHAPGAGEWSRRADGRFALVRRILRADLAVRTVGVSTIQGFVLEGFAAGSTLVVGFGVHGMDPWRGLKYPV
jgi:hypothetical protein